MSAPHALIREARVAAGLTQAALAERARTTQSAIARLERPGANPRLGTLEAVVRAAGGRLELGLAQAGAPGIDETQLRERLRLSPAERLRTFQGSQGNLGRLAAGARRVAAPG